MPNAREGERNNMKDVHPFLEERYVIVAYGSIGGLAITTR